MTDLNDLFLLSSKPTRTLITSGTGTFVPSVDNALCRVRVQGGGGGGASSGGTYAGGGGACIEFWVRVPIAGLAYTVGAAGAVETAGSPTTFGNIRAAGGGPGIAGSAPGIGGILGLAYGSVSASAATQTVSNNLSGVAGGGGGTSSTQGGRVGFPALNSGASYAVSPVSGLALNNGQGNNSGGDSFYGKGGTTGNSPAVGNYGAGGGYNAAGLGGCIEIEDLGA